MTTGESANLRKELEEFKQATSKLSDKINRVGVEWKDQNYTSLAAPIGELAKSSRTVIDSGEKTCVSIEKFFTISEEKI